MGALFSMLRLEVGLIVAVLCGGIAGSGYAREPVLIHVAKHPGINPIAFNFIAFTPNSEAIVLSCNGELSLWKTRAEPGANRVIKRMKAQRSADWVRGTAPVVVSSDGNFVAVPAGGRGSNIAWSNSLQVWDITKSSVVATYAAKEYRQSHSYFTFVPKSTDMYIAVERSLEIWSPTTGKRRVIASADSKEGFAVQHMRVLKDGSLVTARGDGRICLWDTKKLALSSFRNVHSSIYSVAYGGGSIRTHYVVTSPDAKRAAALDYVKTPVLAGDTLHVDERPGYKLTLWDLENGKAIRGLPLGAGTRGASSVAWSYDGRFLAWVSYDMVDDAGSSHECVIWDVIKEKEIMREKPPTGIAIGGVISFSPDGKLLAMPAGTKPTAMVAIWDISDLTKTDNDGDDKEEESRAESKRKRPAK